MNSTCYPPPVTTRWKMTDENITRWLELARAGDREALDRLLEHVGGRLRGIITQQLGPRMRGRLDASDILQSTYLNVVKSIGTFRGEGEAAFVGWVANIARNNIHDRTKYFLAEKRGGPEVGRKVLEAEDRVVDPLPSPSSHAVRIEDLLLVSRALESLSDLHRRVIMMRLAEQASHKEIGDAIGKSEGATRMVLSRARMALALEMDRQAP